MKIYTRKGDDGRTHLFAGPRVTKDDPHIEACGGVDELNALLGLARAESLCSDIDQVLHRVQHELFAVGADLATPHTKVGRTAMIGDGHVRQLEQDIDTFDAQLPPLTEFILPGGSRGAALLHVARTICRRAERRVVTLEAMRCGEGESTPLVRYLNRLSDLLFVLPRVVNARTNLAYEGWMKDDGRATGDPA